jgi:uncharacterized protein YjiS (DUF1127 family)
MNASPRFPLLHTLVARWQQYRLARARAFALDELDNRTLRDLGFHRSEVHRIRLDHSTIRRTVS